MNPIKRVRKKSTGAFDFTGAERLKIDEANRTASARSSAAAKASTSGYDRAIKKQAELKSVIKAAQSAARAGRSAAKAVKRM